MERVPYEQFTKDERILRDELAIDRTHLANERTVLAYARTGLALLITGASIWHLVPSGWFRWLGFACIPMGLIVNVIGLVRFLRVRAALRRAQSASPITKDAPR